MNWTTDAPTQQGWYWFRTGDEEKHTVIVYVISAEHMVAIGTEHETNPAYQKGSWFGPIAPPPFEERESQP